MGRRRSSARLIALCALVAAALSGCAGTVEEAPRSTMRVSTMRVWNAGACPPMIWPVEGPLSSTFGVRDGKPHEGIDLAVVSGTPVRAACDGRVAYAGDRLRGYGRLIIVEHAAGLATVYAHNSRLFVREGDEVARGSVLALSGATGHVTAPHVHFEVRERSRPRDPLEYLPPRPRPSRVADEEGTPTWTTASRP